MSFVPNDLFLNKDVLSLVLFIDFSEVGYSNVVFKNTVCIKRVEQNNMIQIEEINYNILELLNLRGGSKYKFDILPTNLY